MDKKDFIQSNGEQKPIDDSVKHFLGETEPRRKKYHSGRMIIGILLIVVGLFLGLAYLGSVCFVKSTAVKVAPIVNEVMTSSVPSAPVAVQAPSYLFVETASEYVNAPIVRETSGNGDTNIAIGDISTINVKVLNADTFVIIGSSNESQLVITNDEHNTVKYSLESGVLQIEQKEKRANAQIYITVSSVNDINIVSASGNFNISGAGDIYLDDITFITSSGDCKLNSVYAIKSKFQSASGDMNLSNSVLELMDIKTASGDANITNINVGNFSATTASGDIKASQLISQSSIETKTASGDVSFEAISAERLTTNSASGWLKLRDSEVNSVYTASSSGSKNISNTYCREVISKSSSGEFIADNITSQNITINSSSGKAKIDLIPIENINVSVTTSSGNVDLTLASNISIDLKCNKFTENERQLHLNQEESSENKVTITTNSGTVDIIK